MGGLAGAVAFAAGAAAPRRRSVLNDSVVSPSLLLIAHNGARVATRTILRTILRSALPLQDLLERVGAALAHHRKHAIAALLGKRRHARRSGGGDADASSDSKSAADDCAGAEGGRENAWAPIAAAASRSGTQPPLIILTGHSMGAALATIAALDIAVNFPSLAHRVRLITFGSPPVGNPRFVKLFKRKLPKEHTWRVVFQRDFITALVVGAYLRREPAPEEPSFRSFASAACGTTSVWSCGS